MERYIEQKLFFGRLPYHVKKFEYILFVCFYFLFLCKKIKIEREEITKQMILYRNNNKEI